jgi:hypothetical protein
MNAGNGRGHASVAVPRLAGIRKDGSVEAPTLNGDGFQW